jgi:hypothetical protein
VALAALHGQVGPQVLDAFHFGLITLGCMQESGGLLGAVLQRLAEGRQTYQSLSARTAPSSMLFLKPCLFLARLVYRDLFAVISLSSSFFILLHTVICTFSLSSGHHSLTVHIRYCSMLSNKHPASLNCLPTEYLYPNKLSSITLAFPALNIPVQLLLL